MDNFTIAVIVILVLALIFFGFTIIGSNNAKTAGYSSAGSYSGGGCGWG